MLVAAAAGTTEIAARSMRSASGLNSLASLSARVKVDCKVSEITSALAPSENRAAVTITTAMAMIQSSKRPIGYHSSVGGAAASFAFATGRASNARWPSQIEGAAIASA